MFLFYHLSSTFARARINKYTILHTIWEYIRQVKSSGRYLKGTLDNGDDSGTVEPKHCVVVHKGDNGKMLGILDKYNESTKRGNRLPLNFAKYDEKTGKLHQVELNDDGSVHKVLGEITFGCEQLTSTRKSTGRKRKATPTTSNSGEDGDAVKGEDDKKVSKKGKKDVVGGASNGGASPVGDDEKKVDTPPEVETNNDDAMTIIYTIIIF